ncbi:hypothetical protein RR46_02745 [Papilio xuthus]|uniref:Uncharacterized protein n=1 Tax=Papilio xuthus TaxID=66420 RepID=A0A194Q487_PAPXU|nr:hypothetical protein RR46_02745 [Papilio xuthus]
MTRQRHCAEPHSKCALLCFTALTQRMLSTSAQHQRGGTGARGRGGTGALEALEALFGACDVAGGAGSVNSLPGGGSARLVPTFDAATPRNVTALVGKSAYLSCRVRNLGNRTILHYEGGLCTVEGTDERFPGEPLTNTLGDQRRTFSK